jgi:hypothetical protein
MRIQPFHSYLLVFLVICLATASGQFGDHWMNRWGMVLMFMVPLLISLGKEHTALLLLAMHVITNGLAAVFLMSSNSDMPLPVQDAMRLSAAQATLAFGALAIYVARSKDLWTVSKALGWLGQVTGVMMIVSSFGGRGRWVSPLFDNPSMAGSLVVVTLPLYVAGGGSIITGSIIAVVAAVVTKAAAPMLGLFAAGLMMAVNWTERVAILMVGALGLMAIDLGGSGRFEQWSIAVDHFMSASHGKMIFGHGTGSIQILMPLWEKSSWIYLHNDWLQILLEQGIVGLGLALYAFSYGMVRADRFGRAALAAYGATMLINPMLHWPIHALIGAVVIASCVRGRREFC